MAKITKVPNGPLIKKKGPFKGSTLKNGGTTTTKTTIPPSGMIQGMDKFRSPQKTEKPTPPTTPSRTPMNSLPPEPPKRNYIRPADTSPERFPTSGVGANTLAKRGKTISKAKNGKPVKKAAIGALLPLAMKALPMVAGMLGGKKKKMGGTIKKAQTGNAIIDKASKDYKSYSAGTGPKPALSSGFKNGGSTKKCKYGCK